MRYKSAAHKRLVKQHEEYLRSITGKKRPRLKGIQVQKSDATDKAKEHREKYPSLEEAAASNATAAQERIYVQSDTHTVAVGYNKGGYQLVSKDELPSAGRKV